MEPAHEGWLADCCKEQYLNLFAHSENEVFPDSKGEPINHKKRYRRTLKTPLYSGEWEPDSSSITTPGPLQSRVKLTVTATLFLGRWNFVQNHYWNHLYRFTVHPFNKMIVIQCTICLKFLWHTEIISFSFLNSQIISCVCMYVYLVDVH